METIFRQGMIVYDQVNYPNKKGVVVDVEPANDEDDYPIEVKFDDTLFEEFYTLDGRFELGQIPTLSTEPYEIILKGFEQKKSVITYKEIVLENQKQGVYIPTVELKLPNDSVAESFEALAKLIWLRDYYNKGWIPNWKRENNEIKFCIEVCDDEIIKAQRVFSQSLMAFKTLESRDKFINEQIDLLRIAKPLL